MQNFDQEIKALGAFVGIVISDNINAKKVCDL